jgi:hypothetical protein
MRWPLRHAANARKTLSVGNFYCHYSAILETHEISFQLKSRGLQGISEDGCVNIG